MCIYFVVGIRVGKDYGNEYGLKEGKLEEQKDENPKFLNLDRFIIKIYMIYFYL